MRPRRCAFFSSIAMLCVTAITLPLTRFVCLQPCWALWKSWKFNSCPTIWGKILFEPVLLCGIGIASITGFDWLCYAKICFNPLLVVSGCLENRWMERWMNSQTWINLAWMNVGFETEHPKLFLHGNCSCTSYDVQSYCKYCMCTDCMNLFWLLQEGKIGFAYIKRIGLKLYQVVMKV